MFIEHKNIF